MTSTALTYSEDQAAAHDKVAEMLRSAGIDLDDSLLMPPAGGPDQVMAVTGKAAPALGFLALLGWILLALVGSHGLARSLGAKVLGREQPSGPPGDLAEVSLGWAVLIFASAIPILGLFLAAYWCVRATGAAILALLAVEVPVAEVGAGEDPDPAGGVKDGVGELER